MGPDDAYHSRIGAIGRTETKTDSWERAAPSYRSFRASSREVARAIPASIIVPS